MSARRVAVGMMVAAVSACVPRPAAAPSPAAGDARPSAGDRRWVEHTLARMTLRQKLGQMMMPWVTGGYLSTDSPEWDRLDGWVERDGVGGVVVSFGTPHEYAARLNALQSRATVPLLVASDMENGAGYRMSGIFSIPHLVPQGGATNFPPLMALGATGSDSLAYAAGAVLAREARAVGVQMTFGPVLDVNSNPDNPIINTRSFGEDPAAVARLGAAFIRGARDGGLLATGKHFPGHGDVHSDSHLGLPAISATRARLDSVELVPFRAGIRAGLDGVMTAHIAVTGVEGADAPPATLSPYFMTRVLREEMGFRGLLFTDAMDMGGVRARYGDGESVVRAVEAGADVVLMPVDVGRAIDTLEAAVRSGRIAPARIDRSVRLILAAKARAGLRRSRTVGLDSLERIVGTRAHQQVAREIAARSITLARDDRGLLPAVAAARRLLLVTYAQPADPTVGGVFDAMLAAPGRRLDTARVDARTSEAEYAALRARADSADVVIVSAYVSPFEYAGTVKAGLGFPAFVQSLAAAGTPVVAVSFGSPYLLGSFPAVGTYLLAWGGADACQEAAARALLGVAPITGHLPIAVPPYFARGSGLARAATAPGPGTPALATAPR